MEILVIVYAVSALFNIILAIATVSNLVEMRKTLRVRMEQEASWHRATERKVRNLRSRIAMLEGRFEDDRK